MIYRNIVKVINVLPSSIYFLYFTNESTIESAEAKRIPFRDRIQKKNKSDYIWERDLSQTFIVGVGLWNLSRFIQLTM